MNSVSEDRVSPAGVSVDNASTEARSPAAGDSSSHIDKYDDPRAEMTGRGIAIGIGVLLLGFAGAGFSIWARKTRLVETTRFWGPDVITAFQLAEEVELLPLSGESTEPVRLSGMPGLGHLRHVFLDDRSYDWTSERDVALSVPSISEDFIALQFRDPTAGRFPDTKIFVDLNTGWVGQESVSESIQLNERFRKAVPNYLRQIADYEPIRVEMRKEKAKGGEGDAEAASPSEDS